MKREKFRLLLGILQLIQLARLKLNSLNLLNIFQIHMIVKKSCRVNNAKFLRVSSLRQHIRQ